MTSIVNGPVLREKRVKLSEHPQAPMASLEEGWLEKLYNIFTKATASTFQPALRLLREGAAKNCINKGPQLSYITVLH